MTRLDRIREVAERHGGDCYDMIDEIRVILDHVDPAVLLRDVANPAA